MLAKLIKDLAKIDLMNSLRNKELDIDILKPPSFTFDYVEPRKNSFDDSSRNAYIGN